MKAYFIDAENKRITEVQWSDYKDIVEVLPGGLCIGVVFENKDVLYVDDEALLHPAKMAFRIVRRRDGQPMMSNGFLTGPDDPDPLSDTVMDVGMTLQQLQDEIEWLTVDQALNWFRHNAEYPATVFQDLDERLRPTGPSEVLNTWKTFLRLMENKR